MATFNVNSESVVEVSIKGQPLKVDLNTICQAGLDKVFAYGLGRILNDAASAPKYLDADGEPTADRKARVADRPEADYLADAMALAEKRLAALVSGEFAERASKVDQTLASSRVITLKHLRSKGIKPKDAPKLPDVATCLAVAVQHGADKAKWERAVKAHIKASSVDDLS